MKKSILNRISLVFLFSYFIITNIFGANKTFTGTGNFSNPLRWNGGTLPLAGDNLTINGNCTVDNSILTDNVAYGNLIIGGSAAYTLNWSVGGTNRLKIINLSSNVATSNLNMTNGGTLIIVGSWTQANLNFIPGAGTIERQGTITISAVTNFNNLIINTAGTITTGIGMILSGNLTVASGTFDIAGFSFDVAGTTTVNGILTLSSATGAKSFKHLIINGTFNKTVASIPITVSGNFQNNGVYNGGTGRVTFTGATSNTLNGTAASTAFNGGITINKGVSNANVLDVQSVITMPAGGLILTNGTFKLSSASTITPFTVDIFNAPFLVPATAGIWCNGGTMNTTTNQDWSIGGLFRVSAGTVNVGTAIDNRLRPTAGSTIMIDGGTINVTGRLSIGLATQWNFIMSGGVLRLGTMGNTVADRPTFNMDINTCSFSMTGGTMILVRPAGSAGQNLGYYNIAAAGTGFTGGTLQIGDAGTPAATTMEITTTIPVYNLTVNSNNATAQIETNPLTVSNDVNITAGTINANNLDLTINRNFIITASGNFGNISRLYVKGNITNDQSAMVAGTGTLYLNGTSLQTVNGTQTFKTFNFVTNNAAGITLNNDLSVAGAHTFTAGMITTSNANFLIYQAGSSYSGDADSRHVNGWVKKFGNTNFVFPVGNATIERNISLTSLSGVSEFNVKYYGNTPYTNQVQSPLVSVEPNEYWTVNKISGGTASVTMNWDNSKVSFPNYLLSDIRAGFCSINTWTNVGGAAAGNPATTGTITSNSVASFNYFTIGSRGFILPLQIISFVASRVNNSTHIMWTTANEENVNHFDVERSDDGINFYAITQVAARNRGLTENYTAKDNGSIQHIAYYRLNSIDNDGKKKYSQVVSVKENNSTKDLKLVINPVKEQIILSAGGQLNGLFQYNFHSANGQLIKQGNMSIQNGGLYIVSLPANITPGIYLLQVNDPNIKFNYRVLVQ